VLNACDLSTTQPARAVTRLDDVCRDAIASVSARSRRRITYAPQREVDALGYWRAALLTRAVRLVLGEALSATTAEEQVELRWRLDGGSVVVEAQFPRPIESGERLVTFFDADASASEDRRRLVAAREALLELGGTLARVRTQRGTTLVATVPRFDGARPGLRAAEALRRLEAHRGPALTILLGDAPGGVRRLHALMEKASELLGEGCPPAEREALLQPIAALVGAEGLPAGPVAFLRSPAALLALRLSSDVPDTVAIAAKLHPETLAAHERSTVWRFVETAP
jgi:hypothetical protein